MDRSRFGQQSVWIFYWTHRETQLAIVLSSCLIVENGLIHTRSSARSPHWSDCALLAPAEDKMKSDIMKIGEQMKIYKQTAAATVAAQSPIYYGGQFTFKPIEEPILGLIRCPSYVLADLTANNFYDNFVKLVRYMESTKTFDRCKPFAVQFLQLFLDSVQKGNFNIFLSQLRHFIYRSDQFDPVKFRAVYRGLSFASDMDYKTFLQKISPDLYALAVFRLADQPKKIKVPQVKSFCRFDKDLKGIMHELGLNNWTLSKYMVGDRVVVEISESSMLLLDVHHAHHPLLFERFSEFIKSVPLLQHSDFIFNDQHKYKRVEAINYSLVEQALPDPMLREINNLFVVINGKEVPLRDLTVVCFAYLTPHCARVNLFLHIHCLYGNRNPVRGKWH